MVFRIHSLPNARRIRVGLLVMTMYPAQFGVGLAGDMGAGNNIIDRSTEVMNLAYIVINWRCLPRSRSQY